MILSLIVFFAGMADAIAQLFVAMLREAPGPEGDNVNIVEAAAKGDFDDVKKVIKSHPKKVLFTIGLLRTL